MPPAFPSASAFQFGNVDASVVNQGIEFALGYDFVQTEDATFSANFNIAYNENEIQDFAGAINTGEINGPGLSGAFAQRFEEGRSLFSYYMAIFEGFDGDGNPIYTDIDGNGIGDPDADKTFVDEDGLPDITTGLSLNASIKNWDIAAYFAGQFGFSVYNNTANALFNAGQIGTARNITQNVVTSGENPGASTAVSTRFLEKGDFVRFQNATVGYNVPLSEDSALKSLRLSVTGTNLFLITDYSGIDPEVNVPTATLGSGVPTRGVDWSAFPRPLTVNIGVNATFLIKKLLDIMKRNSLKIYLLTFLTVAGLASCTDLEIEETDSFISAGFQGLQDPAASLNALYGQTYGQLGDQANTFALREVTTDAQLIPTRGADWGDNGRWRKLHQHEWGLEETDIITPFQQWTSAQLLASQILDSRSSADAATTAGAHFLRAYAMWTTLDLYGQVPFRDTQLPDNELPTVLSGAAAVDFIIADLDAAIGGLPTVGANAGDDLNRASKAAARFLKAKILLNRHVYENQLAGGGGTANPADMAEVISLVDAITADGFALQAGYYEIFEESADSETIWWAQAGVGNRIFNGLHYNSTGLGGGGWNGFSTLAEFYDLFEGDPNSNRYDADRMTRLDSQEERRGGVPPGGLPFTGAAGTSDNGGFEDGSNVGDGFLIGQQYALDGTALTDRQGTPLQFTREFVDGNGAPSLINNSERTGIRVMKYSPRFGGGFTNHQILFRYSDAHLMKAEAMMRSGGDPTAMVNELRTIRGATPLGSVSEADLLDERGRELFC